MQLGINVLNTSSFLKYDTGVIISKGDSHIPDLQHSAMHTRPDFSRGERNVVRASIKLRLVGNTAHGKGFIAIT